MGKRRDSPFRKMDGGKNWREIKYRKWTKFVLSTMLMMGEGEPVYKNPLDSSLKSQVN